MSTRKPSSTADASTGPAVDALPVSEAPEGVSEEELLAAKQRAEQRDLGGWVNWLARPEKKIAIIGFTPTRDEAPWADPTFEKWACNNLHLHLRPEQKWDRLYDLHDYKTIASDKPHEAFLRQTDKPVYVWQPRPEWPASVEFPKQAVLDSFGNYFTNSISWMVAHAILEGVTELHIYGVDLAQGTEYCLGPETRALTADMRWVPLEDIEVGQTLVAFDENSHPTPDQRYRRWREATVLTKQELVRPCFRVTLEDGTKVIASAEHRWLVQGAQQRWLTTDRMRVKGSYSDGRSTRIVKPLTPWGDDRSWGAGFLAAAFDGEGHLSGNCKTLGFSQRDNAMAAQVERELDARGYRWAKHRNGSGGYNYQISGGRHEVMRFLGEIRPPRLLDKFHADQCGSFFGAMAAPAVVELEYIGDHAVIGLGTTTGTFVAEGLASHNSQQRPSCEHMLGIAQGRGIKIYIPPTSDLLKTGMLYGADDDSFIAAKMTAREQELTARLSGTQQQIAQLQAQANQMAGALEDVRYWRGVWTNPRANRDGSVKVESEQVKPAEAPA